MDDIKEKDDLREIHKQALKNFNDIQSSVRDERSLNLEDRRFAVIAGAQWEGGLGEQFKNKVKIEVNKTHMGVLRIENEYLNNKIDVTFVPKNGDEDDTLSDTLNGLYRADEQDSDAEEAFDNAFKDASTGGIGAWRLRACYEDEEDEENEYQRIRFEPIYDADSSVFFDLSAKLQDKSDAKYCFVITGMQRDAYIEEWEDDPETWNKDISGSEFDWTTNDMVYIAEYYKKEEAKETIVVYQSFDGEETRYKLSELTEELIKQLESTGSKEIRRRKIETTRVHKYILSGGGVLEDCGYIAGKYIPIIPQYGKRWYIDGVERCMGHTRLAKDAQRLKNMQLSKLAELSALSSVEKPILVPEQVAGHEVLWSKDNVENNPYMLVNPITDMNGNVSVSGPIGYTKPPQIAPALAALLQITETDIQDLLGNQQAGEQMNPNLSGKAVELIQNRLDMQAFIYMSNAAKARKHSARVWLSMASEIYVESGRKMKTIGSQDEVSTIQLNKPTIDERTGGVVYENDLSRAKHDVFADVGPASSSKRSATVRNIMNMMQITTDPETIQVLGAMAIMNMEGEGIQDVRDFFRQKLIKLGVVKPTEEEQQQLIQEMQNQQPDAQTLYLQSAAKNEMAKAAKAEADTGKAYAEADATKAKTAEILAGIGRKDQETVMNTAKTMSDIKTKQKNP